MKKLARLILFVLLATALPGLTAEVLAQAHHDFHGRDFHHLNGRDLAVWRGGHWFHDWHDGRYGWWWMVDGGWYFYPEPVYPYPSYIPPAVVVQQPPPIPSEMPAAQFWYYCDNPQGYYPYVASCNAEWRQVAATPPAPSSPPAASPSPPPGPPYGTASPPPPASSN